MFKNYLLTAWRSLRRNGLTTTINVTGLAFGITCSLVIFILLSFVSSYDTFNAKFDRIYRVVVTQDGVEKQFGAGVPSPMPVAMRQDMTGIAELTYISGIYQTVLVQVGDEGEQPRYFQETEGVAYVDTAYFNIFTVPILRGSVNTFDQPKKVVITEKLKQKYFGETPAVGKLIHINREDNYEVIAVMQNAPENSDFPFQMLISYATYREEHISFGWGSVSSDDQIYLTLADETTPDELTDQFPGLIRKYQDDDAAKKLHYFLQPLAEVHSDNRFGNYSQRSFSDANFYSLLLVGVFLIITACVNFINLSTAVAMKRSREIGIRKTMGSRMGQLVFQFLGETFFVVVVSTLISLGLSELLLIQLSSLLNVDLHIQFTPGFVLFLMALTVLITLLAGLYPSFVMSRYKPVEALKNQMNIGTGSSGMLRKSLVTVQFFISQLLIIGTSVILLQMHYINTLPLGFNADAIVNIPVPDSKTSTKRTLKEALLGIPGVQEASLNLSTPASGNISVSNYGVNDQPDDQLSALKIVDEDYIPMYGIPVLAGEGLMRSDTTNQIVVNEKWLAQSGFDNPQDAIGAQVKLMGGTYPVVGVVQNFHTLSAREKLQPVMIFSNVDNVRQISVKINMTQSQRVLDEIKTTWQTLYPEYTFTYEFVDQEIENFYESERNLSKVFLFFSITAIVIGCLGLFGLITFNANRKIKEIGVRKVLGATSLQIFSLFSWDIVRLILLSFVLVVPLAWYIMDRWLENYTYHLPLNPWIFTSGLGFSVILALSTIGYRAMKAARANPADSLRTE